MIIIRKRAYARAGLLGNPSDGYHGKTIAISIPDYWSEVVLYEWDTLEIVPAQYDHSRFRSIYALADDVRLHGYYGGIRLVKATIKRFVEYCDAQGITLHDQNFSVRYESNIPRQVGLAGSSSIIIATLKCLLAFYNVTMPLAIQPSFALSVEMDELGITAGLQDRVIQCYGGAVYMDFDRAHEQYQHGIAHYHYQAIDPLPDIPLYIAHHRGLSEPTEIFHNDIRGRYQRGDADVKAAMTAFASYAAEGYDALTRGDVPTLTRLIDANFDTRRRIARLPDWQVRMVDVARQRGASAKFAGSGGAIVGTYPDEATFARLQTALADLNVRVFKWQASDGGHHSTPT